MDQAWDNDRIIRVDMTRQTVSVEPFPQSWKLLGGRALSAKILLKECDPKCDPLGADNVLVMTPGTLSGDLGADLRPPVAGLQEPADQWHQGSQRRR
ncbi:MAG: hypothetical protein IPG43_05760 [Proteobacteria bacterium]|nr:hypothetical protein [Pseudomonadota bacterium]